MPLWQYFSWKSQHSSQIQTAADAARIKRSPEREISGTDPAIDCPNNRKPPKQGKSRPEAGVGLKELLDVLVPAIMGL